MNKILLIILTCSFFYFQCSEGQKSSSDEDRLKIHIWYGEEQFFGRLGNPQRQINVLGNLEGNLQNARLEYTLNEKGPFSLTLGSDLHRLAKAGDFNVEIEIKDLLEGRNRLVLTTSDSGYQDISRRVVIHYTGGKVWPLPYSIDWSKTQSIRDAVLIVDGKWKLVSGGIRTVEPYYDRTVALGDSTWKNYQVTTSVIFHDFTSPVPGPPTYNVSHAAIAS